jgi:hypothetical protein
VNGQSVVDNDENSILQASAASLSAASTFVLDSSGHLINVDGIQVANLDDATLSAVYSNTPGEIDGYGFDNLVCKLGEIGGLLTLWVKRTLETSTSTYVRGIPMLYI